MKFLISALVLIICLTGQVHAQILNSPGFEDNVSGELGSPDGWDAKGFCSLSDTHIRSGNYSLELYTEGTMPLSGAEQSFLASPGQTFAFDIYSFNTSGNGLTGDDLVMLSIIFYDSSYQPIWLDLVDEVIDAAGPKDVWVKHTLQATAPLGAEYVEPTVQLMGVGPSYCYFDDASFVPEPCSLFLIGMGSLLLRKRK